MKIILTLDKFMVLLFSRYLIKYEDIKNEIIIDTRTKEEYLKNKILDYNIPIINKKEHDFLHKYLLIAEIVIIYGMIRNIKSIKHQLLDVSNNKENTIVLACSKGRLRSPTMWIYAKMIGIDAKVLKGGIVTINNSIDYIGK